MKKFKVSLAVVAALSLYSSANAQSLSEAFTSGKVSGEVTSTYENRNMKTDNGGYYRDSAYSVGSLALKYETQVWNEFSLTSKFRAYGTIFEDEKNSITSYGTGDASERFREKNGSNRTVDLEELFLSYNLENFSVKAGRQFISTDWINKTQDALKIDTNFGNTSIEAIWSLRQGRISARDYRPMTKFNENDGVFKLGLTQKLNDNISTTAYGLMMPDIKDIYGAKVNLKFGNTSIRAHYAISEDDNDSKKDSNLIDLMLSTSIAGFSPYLGYIKVDDSAEFPGYNTGTGEIIVPFEEGDYVYSKGAQTIYVGLNKSFGDLSATLLYGTTEYLDASNKKLEMDETTLWLGYPVTKNLKSNLGYTVINETKVAAHGDYNQVNLTLSYSF